MYEWEGKVSREQHLDYLFVIIFTLCIVCIIDALLFVFLFIALNIVHLGSELVLQADL